MNYSWDKIYPFDDCECDRTCVKTNIMVLSAVSKLQSDYDKIVEQSNDVAEQMKRFDFKDTLINIQ